MSGCRSDTNINTSTNRLAAPKYNKAGVTCRPMSLPDGDESDPSMVVAPLDHFVPARLHESIARLVRVDELFGSVKMPAGVGTDWLLIRAKMVTQLSTTLHARPHVSTQTNL